MAELILNSCGPHKGPGAESYYDFDPSGEEMLKAIESFLARRSGVSNMEEQYLADLCETSIKNSASTLRRATLANWLKMLRNLFRDAGSTGKDDNLRRTRRSRKPGNGAPATGDRRRMSFA